MNFRRPNTDVKSVRLPKAVCDEVSLKGDIERDSGACWSAEDDANYLDV